MVVVTTELQEVEKLVKEAVYFKDVFGEDPSRMRSRFLSLMMQCHPDRNTGNEQMAADIMGEVTQWYGVAEAAVKQKKLNIGRDYLPGKEPVVLDGKYRQVELLAVGDVADVHLGHTPRFHDRSILIKAARYPKDNDMLVAEQRSLKLVRTKMETRSSEWLATVPQIFDSILIGGSLQRRVNIVEYFPGFLTVKEIKERGTVIDGRTLTWMWKRILVLLDWVYRSGVIHGAILPPHVMFFPDNMYPGDGGAYVLRRRDERQHAIRLIDWCYSIEHDARTKLKSWVPEYEGLYAPEIIKKEPLGPTTDMYMAAKTLLWMVDYKNPKSPLIPKSIMDSLLVCARSDPSQRPKNASEHFEAFLKIQEQVYGKPQWHDFIVPRGSN